jgi:endonuclease/exonuclease/phosphatase family metal-dependent hydrolase
MLKILQLNIRLGGFNRKPTDVDGLMPEIVDLLIAGDYDLIALQEVSGNGYTYNKNPKLDCYEYLTVRLSGYVGKIFKYILFPDLDQGYQGVAIFYKADRFEFLKQEDIYMYNRPQPKPSTDRDWINYPSAAILLSLRDIGSNKVFNFVSAHFAWELKSYYASQARIDRAQVLVKHLSNITQPVILTGDTNVDWDSQIMLQFEDIGMRNLGRELKLTNTLNPKQTVYYQDIFVNDPIQSKRGGVPCDNVLLSSGIKLIDLHVLDADVSDHLPLEVDLELI